MSKAFICSRGDISANSKLHAVRETLADSFPMLKAAHLDQFFSGVPCILMVGEYAKLAPLVPRFETIGLAVEIVESNAKIRALSFTKLNWLSFLPEVSEDQEATAQANPGMQTEAGAGDAEQADLQPSSPAETIASLDELPPSMADVLNEKDSLPESDDISLDFTFETTSTTAAEDAGSLQVEETPSVHESNADQLADTLTLDLSHPDSTKGMIATSIASEQAQSTENLDALDSLSLGIDDDLAAELEALKTDPTSLQMAGSAKAAEQSPLDNESSVEISFERVELTAEDESQTEQDQLTEEVASQQSTTFDFSNLSLAPLEENDEDSEAK
ncbi:hypothetical protein [Umboniibacter marinipuniceus]|uniref:Uncharacterized protein n=1 Tax=Umboniibacter marinipuniceus TaxID=569599 RepID=A0A3M0A987_9GAMM|nr:hypothetical protein [Umboniibacter marinipuniceus]RMA80059.1 hypothetical protein DFR27_1415 [Umboniibacter marinipuniceus]